MIEVKNVTKIYNKKNAFTALDNINLTIPSNTSVAILGKSGSGKSTLIHAISGLDKPQKGQVLVDGEDILRLKPRATDGFRASKMAFIFQSFFVEGGESCYNNVSLSLETAGVPVRKRKKLIEQALQSVDLGDKIKLSQEGKILELEIVGIYSGDKTNTFNGLSSDFIENTVYTDYKSSQELSNLIANNKVTSVEYGVEDPTKLDDVIKAVENLGINNLMVSKSNKNYELVTSSVESITKITNMIRIGSVVVGVVILSLILMFWVRERTYEIGILLSLGTSKINLVLQFIVEVLLVTIFGLITALGIEMITIKYLANNVGSIFSEDLPKKIADELMKISVNGIDIVNLVIVMIAIVIISVVVALLPILKMKPKKILTNIN